METVLTQVGFVMIGTWIGLLLFVWLIVKSL